MKKENLLYSTVNLILKIGSYSAFTLVILGVILFLIASDGLALTSKELPLSMKELLLNLSRVQPQGFINLGLLTLMFTPMLTILAALISFSRLKDLKYVAISSGVFLILFSGLMIAIF
jgi:uncharacterized membrane protein